MAADSTDQQAEQQGATQPQPQQLPQSHLLQQAPTIQGDHIGKQIAKLFRRVQHVADRLMGLHLVPQRLGFFKRYAASLLGLAVSTSLTVRVKTLHDSPHLLPFAAVVFGAWYGGIGPGLLVAVLAVPVLNYFLVRHNALTTDLPSYMVFLGVALFVSLLVESQRRTEQQLLELALRDPLTSLLNRTSVVERMSVAIKIAKRNEYPLAVLYLDVDGFKAINDRFGHDNGDAFLKSIAKKLTSSVREEDIVCRLGGDEFIIVLTELSKPTDAAVVCQKIIDAAHAPYTVNGFVMQTTMSIGISVYPADGEDPTLLIKKADAALYTAKTRGRNSFAFYEEVLASPQG